MVKMELDWKVGVEYGIVVFWGGKWENWFLKFY